MYLQKYPWWNTKTLTWVDDHETSFLDVRDGNCIKEIVKIKATFYTDIGLLEFLADQKHSMGKAELSPGIRVALYCAAEGQAALAGKALLDMEFENVVNLGSYQKWKDPGEPSEFPEP